MENLKSNVIILVVAEIVIGLILIYTRSNDSIGPMFLSVLAVNVTSTIFLLIKRPKYYGYLITLLLGTIILPIVVTFYAISGIVC